MKATQIVRQLERSSTIGFVGLGQMGYHMFYNLVKNTTGADSTLGKTPSGFVVLDTNQEMVAKTMERHRKEFPNVPIKVATDPHDLTLQASKIISMIPASTHVQQVYLSPSQSILSALQSGSLSPEQIKDTLCMEQSTIEMPKSKDTSERITMAGARMCDAPVSGGVVGAEKCTLTIMVGAHEVEVFEAAKPVLQAMGKRVIHCGGWGMGLAAKTCNNMMLGISMLGLSEAVLLGKRLGLDAQLLGDIINTSTGQCWASSVNFPQPEVTIGQSSPPSHRDYRGGFVTKLAHKDLAFAVGAAERAQSPLFLGKLAEEIYRPIAQEGHEYANRDFSVMYKYINEDMDWKKGK